MVPQERQSSTKYRKANPAKCAAMSRSWRLANPEKIKEAKRRYRDRKAEREGRVIGRRRRSVVRKPCIILSPGLTSDAVEFIRKASIGAPIYRRDGADLEVNPTGEQIFDKDGRQILHEGDEDLDLTNEEAGGGRRGLRSQQAEASRIFYSEHRQERIERSRLYSREHPEVGSRSRARGVATLRYNLGTRRTLLRNRRVRVLTHYGGGKMVCVLCEEAQGDLLRVDYDGPGQDRVTRHSGDELYRRLEAEGYPEGYHTICRGCQIDIRRKLRGR